MTKFVTPKGVAVWPHLNEPDYKFNAAGEYSTKLRIPAEEAGELIETLEKIRDEYFEQAVKRDPKVKQYKMADLYDEEVDDQGDLTGNYIFKFKQKAVITSKAGVDYDMKIALFDSKRNKTTARIGGGSIIRIAGTAVGYAMPSTKMVGLSLRPGTVQVIELAGNSEAAAALFDIEDGFVADEDTAPAKQTASEVTFTDDTADF